MKPIKKAIILCWIMLFACFLIKILGGNWFEIICTNEHFIKVCAFLDNSKLNYALALILYVSSTCFIIIAESFLKKPNRKDIMFICAVLICVWFSQFISMIVKTVIEAIVILSMPIILYLRKYRVHKIWYWGIIGYALDWAFQILSFVAKNIGIENSLVALILMIDYYIMIALYYLHIKDRKEDEHNGNVGNNPVQRTDNSA